MTRQFFTLLAGIAVGWAAMAYPAEAFLAPTPVTWNASSCPDGIYTITSTALSVDTGNAYTVTSTNVPLPRTVVVQQFSNLPLGTYTVTASAQNSEGAAFSSSMQTVTGNGADAATSVGRHRSSDPVGFAQPRAPGSPANGANSSPGSAASRGGGATRSSAAPSTASAPAAPARTGLAAAPAEAAGSLADQLHRIGNLININADPSWRSIALVDSDDDGVGDVVTIELASGEMIVWTIARHGGGQRSKGGSKSEGRK